jgi:hypothetical protein
MAVEEPQVTRHDMAQEARDRVGAGLGAGPVANA